jgi:[FeFe] hydrogenase H-cluster maturation GTPase HydF
MNTAPRSLRLQIGLFGRTNVGKSSVLNYLAGQDIAITSPTPGTTTDVVEKPMEWLPIGPVVFLDTAGLDDQSELGGLRLRKTSAIFDRADVVALILEPDRWTEFEDSALEEARRRNIPCLAVVNKVDRGGTAEAVRTKLKSHGLTPLTCSCLDPAGREAFLNRFKQKLVELRPGGVFPPATLVGDLVPAGGLAVLIVPIDLQAPKGRLILPQVQTLRDLLDNDAGGLVVKEREYAELLRRLPQPPDLVICDSQVVLKMVADTPPTVPCTTFSILFARFKGDLIEAARGAAAVHRLRPGDRVLIAEACSHHALEDDIGRVKIPRWIRQVAGPEVRVEGMAGRDYPEDLASYQLIVHCGGCMLNRREMMTRTGRAVEAAVPITNYGLCIAALQGVVERVLSPFPAALDAYQRNLS